MSADLLALQLSLRDRRQPHALATVVEILGSSSAKPSAKAVFDAEGRLLAGWIGGGCAQTMVAEAALLCLQSGESCVIDIDLNDEVFGAGMPCGGSMRVYVEPVLPRPMLWLMGHGRIVESLCEFAHKVGFDVTVIDNQATPERLPAAARVVNEHIRYDALQPEAGDYVVIASHHKGDYDSLSRALASGAGYVALVSSRTRAKLVIDRLRQEGCDEAHLGRVRAPAGLNLAAKLPEEIALSIVAEMVSMRRGGGGGSLAESGPAESPRQSLKLVNCIGCSN
ncbi:XdhC family protein [Methylococcus sp. EFPC2]|uniref:XdhC family protein n=1 Tax=Methylococcus sp. EFPC2 TaxID=2812648 RepID=UPI0019684E53|nr:XdhC family protein [Methylococcus sp. EFPC2]QSA96827.1 XdhC family protein [Methylococcus sp. EFPC2]